MTAPWRTLRAEALEAAWALRDPGLRERRDPDGARRHTYLGAGTPADRWHERAACHGITALMYPDNGKHIPAAIAVCDRCPVRWDCLRAARIEDDAIPMIEIDGVRGGTTAVQRRAWQRQVRPKTGECGTDSGYHRHRYEGSEACQPCRDAHTAVSSAGQRRYHIAPAWGQRSTRREAS